MRLEGKSLIFAMTAPGGSDRNSCFRRLDAAFSAHMCSHPAHTAALYIQHEGFKGVRRPSTGE